MLQDAPTKIGLRLSKERLTALASRQITAAKSLKDLPVSSLSREPYVMNEQAFKPLKQRLDLEKTPFKAREGSRESRDFLRYARSGVLTE